jgi:hypothetical protein
MLERQWWDDVAGNSPTRFLPPHLRCRSPPGLQRPAIACGAWWRPWPPYLAKPARAARPAATASAGTRTFPCSAGCGCAAAARPAAPISAALPAGRTVGTALLFAAVGLALRRPPVALLWCGFAGHAGGWPMIDWDTTLLPDSPDPAPALGGPGGQRAGLDRVPLSAVGCGVRWIGYSRCGRCTGCSSWPPARRAWASATSSCWPPWAPGWLASHPAHHPDGVGTGRRGRHRDEVQRQPARGPATCPSAPSWPAAGRRAAGGRRTGAGLDGLGHDSVMRASA